MYENGSVSTSETEVFYFKDITDIQTKSYLRKIETTILKKIINTTKNLTTKIITKIMPIIRTIILVILSLFSFRYIWDLSSTGQISPSLGRFLIISIFAAVAIFCFLLFVFSKKISKKIKAKRVMVNAIQVQATELLITSSSGRRLSVNILNYENTNGDCLSKEEKIIHAVRKLIEEKKVSANE